MSGRLTEARLIAQDPFLSHNQERGDQMDNRQATMRKIELLLSKVGKAENELEAMRRLAEAQELMTKYAIEAHQAVRVGGAAAEHMIEVRMLQQKHTTMIKALRELLHALASLNNCQATLGDHRAYMAVFGHKTDVELVQAMFAVIVDQMQTMMAQAAHQNGVNKSWRVNYAHAYVRRVSHRLDQARREGTQAAEELSPGSSYVLADRSAVVKVAFEGRYSGIHASRMTTSVNTGSDGYYAGDRDARRANLGPMWSRPTNRAKLAVG